MKRIMRMAAPKFWSLHRGACALTLSYFAGHSAFALAESIARMPSPALRTLGGQGGALSGGGTAHVNDVSAADLNPAGIALSREVTLGGEMNWRNNNTQYVEGGIQDSLMSEVAAVLKARLATENSGGKDRRFTLGLAERIGTSSFILGVGGDYSQIERPGGKKNDYDDNPRIRAGVIWAVNESLALGARTDGYFDKYLPKQHALGASYGLFGYYLINADLVFERSKPEKYIGGATVMAKDYLDLRVSYGYAISSSSHFGAAGIVLKSQQFRLFYNLSKPNLRDSQIDQTIGAALSVSM